MNENAHLRYPFFFPFIHTFSTFVNMNTVHHSKAYVTHSKTPLTHTQGTPEIIPPIHTVTRANTPNTHTQKTPENNTSHLHSDTHNHRAHREPLRALRQTDTDRQGDKPTGSAYHVQLSVFCPRACLATLLGNGTVMEHSRSSPVALTPAEHGANRSILPQRVN